jgi:ferredoxin
MRPAQQRIAGKRELHLTVDPIACDGYGYCAELIPEVISLDEWGYPILAPDPVSPRLEKAARRAVRDCPRRAITFKVKLTER